MAKLVQAIPADTNKAEFEAKLKEAKEMAVLVDFHATWCGPCKMIAPKIEAWAAQYTNTVYYKVDVDECEEIAQAYKVEAMPTFIVFKNGEEAERIVGASPDKVEGLIKKHDAK